MIGKFMKFEEALKLLREGKKLTRSIYINRYLYLDMLGDRKYIFDHHINLNINPSWEPRCEDLLAEDWELYD